MRELYLILHLGGSGELDVLIPNWQSSSSLSLAQLSNLQSQLVQLQGQFHGLRAWETLPEFSAR